MLLSNAPISKIYAHDEQYSIPDQQIIESILDNHVIEDEIIIEEESNIKDGKPIVNEKFINENNLAVEISTCNNIDIANINSI